MLKEYHLTFKIEDFPFISDKLEDVLDCLEVSTSQKAKVLIVIDEHTSNLLKNNENSRVLVLEVTISSSNVLIVELEDNGKAFDPKTDWIMPTISDVEKEEPGGLGIFLMNHLADEMVYSYSEGKNKTKFEFY